MDAASEGIGMLGRVVHRHGGDEGHTVTAGETSEHVVLADPP
jgi:hypothetical protein